LMAVVAKASNPTRNLRKALTGRRYAFRYASWGLECIL